MILSKNYKNAMDKITVDEQMKNRILKNITNINDISNMNNKKEIGLQEQLKSKTIKKFKHNYYRNLGILAACCAVVIYTLNNKYIFDFNKFSGNSHQNTEIAFNESQDLSETLKSRERIEEDLKENKGDLENVADTSKSEVSMKNKTLNNDKINNDSDNRKSVNSSLNNELYKADSEGNNNFNGIKENNYSNDKSQEIDYNNENSQNNNVISEENDSNTKEIKINKVETEITQYSGEMASEANEGDERNIRREFKTLDELRKSIDFPIKIPKVQSESNEIKSIIMNSNKSISIEYENKNYSLIFKIEKEISEENLDEAQYEIVKVININENPVLLKGNNNIINTANWREGNIFFEIEAISGVKEEEIINIIKNIE